eukprot:74567-Lingulodinium_polyedra.AAC.1
MARTSPNCDLPAMYWTRAVAWRSRRAGEGRAGRRVLTCWSATRRFAKACLEARAAREVRH